MIYCIDTNSILDFCYRYYPQDMFGAVWTSVSQAIQEENITFIISEHIHEEIYQQAKFKNYDPNSIDAFLNIMQVQVVKKPQYEISLITLSNNIKAVSNLKDNTIDKNGADLSNICLCQSHGAFLVTAEQGTNKKLSDPTNKRLKLPDVCQHFDIDCGGWTSVFQNIRLDLA